MTTHLVDVRGDGPTLRAFCGCGWTAYAPTRSKAWDEGWRHRQQAQGLWRPRCARCGVDPPMAGWDICAECDFDPFPEDEDR